MATDPEVDATTPDAGPAGDDGRALHRGGAWIVAGVAVAATIAIAACAPGAVTGNPTVEIVSQVLLVLAAGAGLYVLLRRGSASTTAALLALLTGLFLAGGAAVLLNANAFGPLGAALDQGFRTAQITRFAAGWDLTDFAYRGLPAYYPPLYFWVLGRLADLFGIAPWQMIKVGLVAVAAAVPVVTWALWRRIAGDLPAAAIAVLASLLYQDWYAPYLWIAVVVFVPWWLHWGLGVGRDPRARWSAGDLAVGIALGAFVLTTYWFLLAIAAAHLAVATVARRFARHHGMEVLPGSWRGPGIVMAGTLVVTSAYWVPYAVSYVTTSGAQMMQNRYFTTAEITLPTPFLDFDLRGTILLAGLLYLAATCLRRALSLQLLGVVVGAYVICIVSYFGFLVDTPLKPERTHGVITDALAVGAALGFVHLLQWSRRAVGSRFDARALTGVALVVGIAVVFGLGQTAVRAIPYLEEQREAAYPRALLAEFERATRDRYQDAVVLTDVSELNTFLPLYVFNTSDAHYAHPAALFNDRADLLTALGAETDPDVFALALLHNRYDTIDYVALRGSADELRYSWLADAFPVGVTERSVTFPVSMFADDAFVPLRGSQLTMFRVDRDRDPLARLRRCPARPLQDRCAVLGVLLDRYSGHLDRETRDLATRWSRAS